SDFDVSEMLINKYREIELVDNDINDVKGNTQKTEEQEDINKINRGITDYNIDTPSDKEIAVSKVLEKDNNDRPMQIKYGKRKERRKKKYKKKERKKKK